MDNQLSGLSEREVLERRERGEGGAPPSSITKTKSQIFKENILTLFNFLNFTIAVLLFIVGAYRRVRVGSIFLAIAHQEREKHGLENHQVHDTDGAVRTAVEAIREMIRTERGL